MKERKKIGEVSIGRFILEDSCWGFYNIKKDGVVEGSYSYFSWMIRDFNERFANAAEKKELINYLAKN